MRTTPLTKAIDSVNVLVTRVKNLDCPIMALTLWLCPKISLDLLTNGYYNALCVPCSSSEKILTISQTVSTGVTTPCFFYVLYFKCALYNATILERALSSPSWALWYYWYLHGWGGGTRDYYVNGSVLSIMEGQGMIYKPIVKLTSLTWRCCTCLVVREMVAVVWLLLTSQFHFPTTLFTRLRSISLLSDAADEFQLKHTL